METTDSMLCIIQNNRALFLKIDVAVQPGFVLLPSQTVLSSKLQNTQKHD